jgi:Resolvase, N terminal domain
LRIDLFLHQQGLDTTTPAGKALFQMLGVFAEFERAIIQERVRAGLARGRTQDCSPGLASIPVRFSESAALSTAQEKPWHKTQSCRAVTPPMTAPLWKQFQSRSEVCSLNISRPYPDVADWSVDDPSATLAVHCSNGFDADFSPYQITRLRR